MGKVLLYASNAIGELMAGPAIRTWEFAQALSEEHEVIVVSPQETSKEATGFHLIAKTDPRVKHHLKTATILIAQTLDLPLVILAKYYGVPIILDAYDPVPLEFLELFKQYPLKVRNEQNRFSLLRLAFEIQIADAVICASEKQRDLWMGVLLAHHAITPALYDQDNSLRKMIDVVPFGLSSLPPKKTGPGFREKYGFKDSDKLILWGGGIWNWFDPISLIKAVKRLSLERSDIKLVFMGIKNPDPKVPEMHMCGAAIQLAQELDLLDKTVFFNRGWIPYDERQNYLLEANIGVSTHFDHLETRYSFRTRMLDYLWAQLPILATIGDSFAELVQQQQLGLTVPYQDEESIAQAIVKLVDDQQLIETIKKNLAQAQHSFFWQSAVDPIRRMIDHFTHTSPSYRKRYQDFKHLYQFVRQYGTAKVKSKVRVAASYSKQRWNKIRRLTG